jgi:hypothetical protein
MNFANRVRTWRVAPLYSLQCTVQWNIYISENVRNSTMYIHTFLLRVSVTMTSQNIDLFSWETLYGTQSFITVFTRHRHWSLYWGRYESAFVGSKVLTPVVMKSSVVWDIKSCSPLKVNRSFGETGSEVILLPASRWFLACIILRPWRWKLYFPPKHRLTFSELHGVISQKIELFSLLSCKYIFENLDTTFSPHIKFSGNKWGHLRCFWSLRKRNNCGTPFHGMPGPCPFILRSLAFCFDVNLLCYAYELEFRWPNYRPVGRTSCLLSPMSAITEWRPIHGSTS